MFVVHLATLLYLARVTTPPALDIKFSFETVSWGVEMVFSKLNANRINITRRF